MHGLVLLGAISYFAGFLNRKYLHNIKLVDEGISKVVQDMSDFYGNDEKTAYVFTADHGMTDWGKFYNAHK